MAFERKWLAIAALPLVSDGTDAGEIFLTSTERFKAKQRITLRSTSQNPITLEVKRVLSPIKLVVGPLGKDINERSDVSDYTTGDSATIEAPEQSRPSIPEKEYERAVYEEEPTVAKRVINVDQYGQFYTSNNPLSVRLSDGSIDIGTVNAELEVQLSHRDNYPDAGDVADSVQIGDGQDTLEINDDGSVNVNVVPSPNAITVGSYYNEVVGVAASTPTTVASYTVPPGNVVFLHKIFCSGTNIAEYRIKQNGTVIDKDRTYFGDKLGKTFDFSADLQGVLLSPGDTILIEVEHDRPMVGDFNGRIQTIEI